MTKVIVLTKEFTEEADIQTMQAALEQQGMTDIEYDRQLLPGCFLGNYEGDLENIKALKDVENASIEVRLSDRRPFNVV